MHTTEIIPNAVIFLIGHPCPRHEDKEDDIHDHQHDNQPEDLYQGRCYDCYRYAIFFAD